MNLKLVIELKGVPPSGFSCTLESQPTTAVSDDSPRGEDSPGARKSGDEERLLPVGEVRPLASAEACAEAPDEPSEPHGPALSKPPRNREPAFTVEAVVGGFQIVHAQTRVVLLFYENGLWRLNGDSVFAPKLTEPELLAVVRTLRKIDDGTRCDHRGCVAEKLYYILLEELGKLS